VGTVAAVDSAAAPDPEANIIFGAVIDDSLGDEVKVTVIAAGFNELATNVGSAGGLRPVERRDAASAAETPAASAAEPTPTPAPAPLLEDDEDDEDDVFRRPDRAPLSIGDDDDLDIPSFLKR
jgi:cell division protein FtsZ